MTSRLAESTSVVYVLSVYTEYTVTASSLYLCEPKKVSVYLFAGSNAWIWNRVRLSAPPGDAAKSNGPSSAPPRLPSAIASISVAARSISCGFLGRWTGGPVVTIGRDRSVQIKVDRRGNVVDVDQVQAGKTGLQTVPIITVRIRINYAKPAERSVAAEIDENRLRAGGGGHTNRERHGVHQTGDSRPTENRVHWNRPFQPKWHPSRERLSVAGRRKSGPFRTRAAASCPVQGWR